MVLLYSNVIDSMYVYLLPASADGNLRRSQQPSLIEVPLLVFIDHLSVFMRIAFNLQHGLMDVGVEIQSAGRDRFNTILFQTTEELIPYEGQPLLKSFHIVGAACRLHRPVQAVQNRKEIPQQIFMPVFTRSALSLAALFL